MSSPTRRKRCADCNGAGRTETRHSTAVLSRIYKPCNTCSGTGRSIVHEGYAGALFDGDAES